MRTKITFGMALDGAKWTAKNAALGDNGFMSDYRINAGEHVVITLDATVDAGSALGIMLAFNDYNEPFSSWACMNMDLSRPSTRLFLYGGPDNELGGEFTAGTPYTLSLEIMPDSTAWCYLNGELYGSLLTMDRVAKNIRALGFSYDEVFGMTSATPAEAIGLEKVGRLEEGYLADVLVIDADFNVKSVFTSY